MTKKSEGKGIYAESSGTFWFLQTDKINQSGLGLLNHYYILHKLQINKDHHLNKSEKLLKI